MTPEPKPSTAWKEIVAADEEIRYAGYARRFAEIQQRKSARHGPGRTLHRKQLTAAQGTLEVLNGLPPFVKYGLFATPGEHEVWVRLSNGGMDRAPDSAPDIRGFAIKVFGVRGAAALGHGMAVSQDFLLINQEAFAFAGSAEFVDLVVAASHGNGSLVRYLFKRYGPLGGTRQLVRAVRMASRPFGGFACEPLFSNVPMACGPFAVRVRLVPAETNGAAQREAKRDWNADFSARLARQALHWDLQLQPFVSEDTTPIEDASVNWPTPYTTVARLMLPRQDTAASEGLALAQKVEGAVFDPWQALVEHRPLGDVQRARKVVYFESQKGRGAAG